MDELTKLIIERKEYERAPISFVTGKLVDAFKTTALLLFGIFFLLYLFDKINWSLWFVTLPLWYSAPIMLIAMFLDWIRNIIIKKKKND